MNETIEYRVKGKVQGVFFRKYTKKAAESYGVTGWVMNSKKSKQYVLGIAQGTKDNLNKFVKFLHNGSPKAEVESVLTNQIDNSEKFTSFEIRREG